MRMHDSLSSTRHAAEVHMFLQLKLGDSSSSTAHAASGHMFLLKSSCTWLLQLPRAAPLLTSACLQAVSAPPAVQDLWLVLQALHIVTRDLTALRALCLHKLRDHRRCDTPSHMVAQCPQENKAGLLGIPCSTLAPAAAATGVCRFLLLGTLGTTLGACTIWSRISLTSPDSQTQPYEARSSAATFPSSAAMRKECRS